MCRVCEELRGERNRWMKKCLNEEVSDTVHVVLWSDLVAVAEQLALSGDA